MPIPPLALAAAAVFFLARSNLGGVALGALLTLGAMYLWPDVMQVPYEWVAGLIDSLGIRDLIHDGTEAAREIEGQINQ
nr:hypothetical protein [uncultured Halomonas sp.]